MNRKDVITTSVLAVLIALLTAGIVQKAGQASARQRIAASSQRARADRIQELTRDLAKADLARSDAEMRLKNAPKLQPPQFQGPPGMKTITLNSDDYPELAAVVAAQNKKICAIFFGRGLGALHLPPDKVARIYKLFSDYGPTLQDTIDVTNQMGIKLGSPEYLEAVSESVGPIGEQAKAIMGDDAFAQYVANFRQSKTTMGQAMIVQQLVAAGVPMTDDQTAAVTRIQAEFQPYPVIVPRTDPNAAAVADLNRQPPDPQTGIRPVDQNILDGEAQVLSPQQIDVLRQNLVDQGQMTVMRQAVTKQVEAEMGVTDPIP